jgi:hypothetical protein
LDKVLSPRLCPKRTCSHSFLIPRKIAAGCESGDGLLASGSLRPLAYLHAGKDIETKRAFEKFLVERGYQIAPVGIDNQGWVFAEVYARALRRRDLSTMRHVGTAYIAYMEEMFDFFERLSIEVVGYEIEQVLLLHDNPLNADYFDQLVQMMRKRAYAFITLEQALKDPAYRLPDNYAGPEGLSWIHRWAISKGLTRKVEPREPSWIRRLLVAR